MRGRRYLRLAYKAFVAVGGPLAVLFALIDLAGCGSMVTRYPSRRCLYDGATMTRWRAGTATMQRADGAILFRFDDPAEGDKGTYWFIPLEPGGFVDERGKRLLPCRQSTTLDPWGGRDRR